MSAPIPVRAGTRRRAAAGVLVAVCMVMLLGVAALAVDMGMLYSSQADLQRTADAAALAAAQDLLDMDRLGGTPDLSDDIAAARASAMDYANRNPMLRDIINVDANLANSVSGDVIIGYLSSEFDDVELMAFDDPDIFNTVRVRVRRDDVRNGPVDLIFARVMGFNNSDLYAEATAIIKDGVTGFRISDPNVTSGLLPLALHVDIWNALISGVNSTGDNFVADPDTQVVTPGNDGIDEINLYPGAGPTQLPPGNFGTVDIGAAGNSTADLARQILYGINQADLDALGGSVELDMSGMVDLNGDTGLSAGIGDELAAIIGMPRTIPLFNNVTGPGNNATFTVVGFAGIQILEVQLTGPPNQKRVIIQPAFVVDETAITGPDSGSSYFVYQPVQLIR